MMIPEAMRFYGWKVNDCLDEFATTFFSMVNAMNRIQGREGLRQLAIASAGFNGDETVHAELMKQSKGLHGILEEVRVIKGK